MTSEQLLTNILGEQLLTSRERERTMTTREKIIKESLELFSVYGYDSVSVRAIADKVGVTNSALYKHFKGKMAILEAILEESKKRFVEQYTKIGIEDMQWDNLEELCMAMFEFQTKDEWITKFRKILIMEQFKNQELAALYQQFFIEMPVICQAEIFQSLIQQGILKDNDATVMSMELYAPFFMYHTVNNETKDYKTLLKKHVHNFIISNMEASDGANYSKEVSSQE